MKAIILAAGRGSRLRERTAEIPKCLVPLAGRPLLEWQLHALREAGISDTVVVRGYRSELLDGPCFRAVDNPAWASTNMVSSLLCAGGELESGPAIVSYADIVYHPDVVRRVAEADGEVVVAYDRLWAALWRERFANPLDDAESFRSEGGRLVEIGRRAATMDEVEGQYMGLLRISPSGWARIHALLEARAEMEVASMDMTTLLRHLLVSGTRVDTVAIEGRWCEVDNVTDLALYERKLAEGAPWTHDWR